MTTETIKPEVKVNPPSRLDVITSTVLNLAGRTPLIGEWLGDRLVQSAQNRVVAALYSALGDWQNYVAKYTDKIVVGTTAVDIPCIVGPFGGMQQIPSGYNVLAANVGQSRGKLRVTYRRTVGENFKDVQIVNIGDVYKLTHFVDWNGVPQIQVIALFDNGGLGRGTQEMMLAQMHDVDSLDFLAKLIRMASIGAKSKQEKYMLSE